MTTHVYVALGRKGTESTLKNTEKLSFFVGGGGGGGTLKCLGKCVNEMQSYRNCTNIVFKFLEASLNYKLSLV